MPLSIRPFRREGFTLTELAVVIAIIAILAALSFMLFHHAARSVQSHNDAVNAAKAQVERSQAAANKKLMSAKPAGGLFSDPVAAPAKSTGAPLHAMPVIDDTPGRDYAPFNPDEWIIPQEYIVAFTPDVGHPRVEAMRLATQYKGQILNVYSKIAVGCAIRIPDEYYEQFRRDPAIARLESNMRVVKFQQKIPTGISRTYSYPALPANQLILRRVVQKDTQRNIRFPQTPISGYQMINVAVIDTGVDPTHPDLNVVMSVAFGNFPTHDEDGHGTHVAGTVGARSNAIGVVGAYPGAPIWSLRIFDSAGGATTAVVLESLTYVHDHAHIIRVCNMSIGGGASPIVNQFVDACAARGVIMVAAAGNFGIPASFFSPASAASAVCVAAMADSDGIMGKKGPNTSAGPDDTMPVFSNWGPAVDVIAPGVDILSTWPVSMGSYNTINGTSMACPHVAGYIAFLLDRDTVFGRTNRNVFIPYKPGVAVSVPQYVPTIATEVIPGILGDPLRYPMVNFRIQ